MCDPVSDMKSHARWKTWTLKVNYHETYIGKLLQERDTSIIMVGSLFWLLPVSLLLVDLFPVGLSSMHEFLIKICSLSFVILTIFIYIIETTNRLNVSSNMIIESYFIKLRDSHLNVDDSMTSIYRFGLGFFSKPVVYLCQTTNTGLCWVSPKLYLKTSKASDWVQLFLVFFRVRFKADGP